MKKTHKKILGVFGLALVATMTFVATQLPSPDASAITEVKDTLSVRVVGEVASAIFTKPSSGQTLESDQIIGIQYENAGTVKLSLTYTDADGNVTSDIVLWEDDTLDYYAGSIDLPVDLSNYGYGKFLLTLSATDLNGVTLTTDTRLLEYMPTKADFSGDEATGDLIIDLEYDEDEVGKVVVDIYVDGKPVHQVEVESPTKQIRIPASTVDSWGEGDITFVVTTYNKNNQQVYQTEYNFTEIPNTGTGGSGAPDTGGLFQNLNIAREDYLITGLIIFFIFAIVAFGVVARSRKSNRK